MLAKLSFALTRIPLEEAAHLGHLDVIPANYDPAERGTPREGERWICLILKAAFSSVKVGVTKPWAWLALAPEVIVCLRYGQP